MAHRNKPVAGSRAYRPLKRAKTKKPRINSWPQSESKVLGFTGYKAGMTHCMVLDETKTSATYGTEISIPVTILEAPPMKVVGVRLYVKGYGGTQSFTDIWCEEHDTKKTSKKRLEDAEKKLDNLQDIFLITYTQTKLLHMAQKIPDVMELALSGEIKEKLDYAKSVLGKEITVKEVFKEKQFIDLKSVTKGKGYGGVIKRYGVRKQASKANGKRRHMGTGGSWKPKRKLWVEGMAGQVGYHTRTEYNKLILKVGENGAEVTPDGGFLKYGPVKNDYIMVYGSVPGSQKRIVRMTFPRRSHKPVDLTIKNINTKSKQGI